MAPQAVFLTSTGAEYSNRICSVDLAFPANKQHPAVTVGAYFFAIDNALNTVAACAPLACGTFGLRVATYSEPILTFADLKIFFFSFFREKVPVIIASRESFFSHHGDFFSFFFFFFFFFFLGGVIFFC